MIPSGFHQDNGALPKSDCTARAVAVYLALSFRQILEVGFEAHRVCLTVACEESWAKSNLITALDQPSTGSGQTGSAVYGERADFRTVEVDSACLTGGGRCIGKGKPTASPPLPPQNTPVH